MEIVDSGHRYYRYNRYIRRVLLVVLHDTRPRGRARKPSLHEVRFMSLRRVLVLSGSILFTGCVYNAQDRTNRMVCDLATHPMDPAPPTTHVTGVVSRTTGPTGPTQPATDAQTSALLCSNAPPPPTQGIRQVAYQDNGPGQPPQTVADIKKKFNIPSDIPGADAAPIPNEFSRDPAVKLQQIRAIYAKLPPLPDAPKAVPGPNGKPYTLADLQQIAAANSPTLRQAASDVEQARGNLIQSAAYPNPTVGYQLLPSNDGTQSGGTGFTFDQVIKTAGKLQLQAAAAQKALDNAELALKRAHSDLATQVRNAYFALLVADETVRINRSLARFTDDVYLLQIDMAEPGVAAPYEPAALRAQAYTVRLALYQSIQNYVYSWKQLVSTIGDRQLPLSQVSGRVDAMIPYYDYDAVLEHVLKNHTAVLTARNGIDQAKANLKLQQVTPIGDVNLSLGLSKELVAAPKLWTQTVGVSVPIPIWDQNRGAILAAEAALIRAAEEPHRVEVTLTNGLANVYNNYTSNLAALEYYRRYILPDLVRTYRALYLRRGTDPGVQFADIVAAQQTLVTNVATYLNILGQLWTSVTGVADYLETDNLFQVGQPMGLPALPDFENIPGWPCSHPCQGSTTGAPTTPGSTGIVTPAAAGHTLPAPMPTSATTRNAVVPAVMTTPAPRPAPAAGIKLDVLMNADSSPSNH